MKLGIIGIPLSGCSKEAPSKEDDPIGAAFKYVKSRPPEEILADARKQNDEMQELKQTILNYNVSYEVEPRFFPSLT